VPGRSESVLCSVFGVQWNPFPLRAVPAMLLVLTFVTAATASSTVYVVKSTDAPPTLDGALDEACWNNAQTISELTSRDTGKPAQATTLVKMVCDGKALYLAAECLLPEGEKVVAEAVGRDGPVFNDDCIEIFLDVEGKGKTYYHLAANSRGAQYDALRFNLAWDGDWQVACKQIERGWTAEVRIPFHALQVTRTGGHLWRANVCRVAWVGAATEISRWRDTGPSSHMPHRFGELAFGDLLTNVLTILEYQAEAIRSETAALSALLNQNAGTGASASRDEALARIDALRESVESRTELNARDWPAISADIEDIVSSLRNSLWKVRMDVLDSLPKGE